jgi:hypothetical protein
MWGEREEGAGHQWLMSVILATQKADQQDHSLKPAQANSL